MDILKEKTVFKTRLLSETHTEKLPETFQTWQINTTDGLLYQEKTHCYNNIYLTIYKLHALDGFMIRSLHGYLASAE